MVRQLEFISIILREPRNINYVFAVDILQQLYKQKNGMSLEEMFSFFKNKNKCEVWETVITLNEHELIIVSDNNRPEHYRLSDKGLEKLQMVHACLKL